MNFLNINNCVKDNYFYFALVFVTVKFNENSIWPNSTYILLAVAIKRFMFFSLSIINLLITRPCFQPSLF